MRYITQDEFWRAASRWQDIIDDMDRFEDFTGIKLLNVGGKHRYFVEVSEDTKRRIHLLLGPDYRAIIKAWLATYGERDD